METLFLICAIVGGTLMMARLVLSLIGLGGGHDVDGGHEVDVGHDADVGHDTDVGHDGDAGDQGHAVGHGGESSWFFGVLTFRSIVAALTFFGLAGMTALRADFSALQALALAIAAGAGALYLINWIMKSLTRLQADGTVRIEKAVGKVGTVYLSIPGQKAGAGKVHLSLNNRTVEYQALTPHAAGLATGARVLVVAAINSDTVEVVPATDAVAAEPGSVTHA
ncbi:MAG: hypothetical protein L0Z62_16190 [Gemmataceae bacterium]|nr:hypothetical protein [Gemmataceae bacterium]